MTISASAGPLVVFGQNPPQAGTNTQPDYNGDNGPSAFAIGTMTLDGRYGFRAALQAGALAAFGFYRSAQHMALDQAPAVLAANNIANVGGGVTAGVPLALQATTAAGITVSTAPLTVQPSGNVLPAGTRFIDGLPGQILFGQSGAVAVPDPRTMIGRCVSIFCAAGASGGLLVVRGADIYGYPLTENITAVANSIINGKKGFKSIASITPAFTNAGFSYQAGTTDIFEFPIAVYAFSAIDITWNNTFIVANTGIVAADPATPTATTGSVRGTYAVQTASDGTKRLQLMIMVMPWNTAATGPASMFGQINFAG